MNPISIRQAEEKDINYIIEFNKAMALETEGKILDENLITKGVENLFRNKEYGFYLVAENENNVVACLMITTEWSDWRNGLFWWVQSVYVKPEFRRQGVYSKMYRYVKQLAVKNKDICGFRLYVEKDNSPAQKTYKKNGMQLTDYLLFEEITRI